MGDSDFATAGTISAKLDVKNALTLSQPFSFFRAIFRLVNAAVILAHLLFPFRATAGLAACRLDAAHLQPRAVAPNFPLPGGGQLSSSGMASQKQPGSRVERR